MKDLDRSGYEVDICVVGNKAAGFFSAVGGNVVAQLEMLAMSPMRLI